MKLEKNNKYSKKITNGLSAILLSISILTGCVNTTNNVEEPIEIVEEVKKELDSNDANYYYDFSLLELTDEEKEEKMSALNIKYPNAIHLASYISTIVVKDNEENYKILQVLSRCDANNNIMHLYDIFTEEYLFDIPYEITDDIIAVDNVYNGFDLTKATNKISYFDDKEIIEYGLCAYSTYYIYYHMNDIINQTGINYKFPNDKNMTYLYPNTYVPSKLKFTTKQIADNYVKTVPQNMQVTAKELGVEITYPKERKYADFWKISDEEREERYRSLGVEEENTSITMEKCSILVLKDSKGNYKLLPVCYFIENDGTYFYNIFTLEFLFSINRTDDLVYDYDNELLIIDFSILNKSIPYFTDKTFVKLDDSTGINRFMEDYIDLKSKNDGINYDYPDSGWQNYLFPYENGTFATNEVSHTIKEIGEAYVTIVPKEFQVTEEELKIGMDEETIEGTNKVLVK